jgi:purine nucleoside permease
MHLSIATVLTALSLTRLITSSPIHPSKQEPEAALRPYLSPKVFIISMFTPEAATWWRPTTPYNLLAHNITVPGFSPLFPSAHCTSDGTVCQLITGEGEINAAVTLTALTLSPLFDLRKTYFLIGGIGGVNPEVATISSVVFSRYAVQVALQYEFDVRDVPENFTTGYVAQGAKRVGQYPGDIYGTEVFEVNDELRHLAVGFARRATLNDSAKAVEYRAMYASKSTRGGGVYAAGAAPPNVVECDVATSDTYFSGKLLGEAFANYTELVTNGTGVYCISAQEDNASLEALLRAHVSGFVDFSRIIIMRTASDMDRPFPGEEATTNLFWANQLQGAFEPAVENIYLAGVEVVKGILDGWGVMFERGINATNYVGDIFGTIGGMPDFGPGTVFANEQKSFSKRMFQ